jgi:hypothetical protein
MVEIVRHRRLRAAAGLGALAALLMAASVAAQSPSTRSPSAQSPSDQPPSAPQPYVPAGGAKTLTAGPATAPSAEALQLATVIAHGYIESAQADLPAQFDDMMNMPIFKSAPFHSAPFNDPAVAERVPGWIAAMRHATFAAVADSKPRLETLLAHGLAEHMSIDELRAGAKFMNSPGGQYAARIYMYERPMITVPPSALKGPMRIAAIQTIMAANAKAHRPLPAAAQAALFGLGRTAAGRQFIRHARNAGVLLADYKADYLRAVMGPIFLHLSEDMAADQARHDAAAQDAPTPEALALGESVVHGAYAGVDDKAWTAFSNLFAAAMTKVPTDQFKSAGLPPEYFPMIFSTMLDTLHYDQPVMEHAIGRALARLCTVDDLRSLSEFTNGPAPAYFVKTLMAHVTAVKGEKVTPPEMPPEVRASADKLLKSGMAERFSAKLQDKAAKEKLVAIGIDVTVPIMVQWMHRLGEKSESLEAERQAARGW